MARSARSPCADNSAQLGIINCPNRRWSGDGPRARNEAPIGAPKSADGTAEPFESSIKRFESAAVHGCGRRHESRRSDSGPPREKKNRVRDIPLQRNRD
jgi:hypothetical protein